MAQATATTITSRPTVTPAIIYLPEIHSVGGNYFPELRTGDTTKATLVADIASAQHDDVTRVLAIDPSTGKCWDASAEVARAVLDVILNDYSKVPAWCEGFLEHHLGIHNVREAEYEHRHAA